jgi:hypothetical protein
MLSRLEIDRQRFREIIKGRVKKELRKYLKPGSIILPTKDQDIITIPVPMIDLPDFRYGENFGGIGQGPGEPGQDLGSISKEPGDAEKQAGIEPGSDFIDIEITIEELLEMLEAELPRIQPKGTKMIESEDVKYTSIRKIGPESLRHMKRTWKEALKREVSEGTYDPQHPVIIPTREDKRYRSWEIVKKPQNNAVVIFMRDVSGSMGSEEREIVRYVCWLTELWLRRQYDALETAYLAHDTRAWEVPTEKEFLEHYSGGGTVMSSVHEKLAEVINRRFLPKDWNIYPVYFSDGFNWGEDDKKVIERIKMLLPDLNQYAYGEIDLERWWWKGTTPTGFSAPGRFGHALESEFVDEEKIVYTTLKNTNEAFDAFKIFFGKQDDKSPSTPPTH